MCINTFLYVLIDITLFCSLQCTNDPTCNGFKWVENPKQCELHTLEIIANATVSNVEDAMVQIDSQALRILLLQHLNASATELFDNVEIGYNQGDPSSNIYSILDAFDDDEGRFRSADGWFHFELCYPGT